MKITIKKSVLYILLGILVIGLGFGGWYLYNNGYFGISISHYPGEEERKFVFNSADLKTVKPSKGPFHIGGDNTASGSDFYFYLVQPVVSGYEEFPNAKVMLVDYWDADGNTYTARVRIETDDHPDGAYFDDTFTKAQYDMRHKDSLVFMETLDFSYTYVTEDTITYEELQKKAPVGTQIGILFMSPFPENSERTDEYCKEYGILCAIAELSIDSGYGEIGNFWELQEVSESFYLVPYFITTELFD